MKNNPESYYSIETIKIRLKCAEAPRPALHSPEEAVSILRSIYENLDADQEHFVVLALNKSNKINGYKVIHSGAIDQTLVSPATLFRFALLFGATGLIVSHNHPSGNTNPSLEDREMTKRIADIGAMLGIQVTDHIILTDNDSLSFREKGIL